MEHFTGFFKDFIKSFSDELDSTTIDTILEKFESENYQESLQRLCFRYLKNGMKKPKNAYTLFCQSKRDDVKEKNQSLSSHEITQKLSEMWKKEKEKNSKIFQKFEQEANEEKTRYNEAVGIAEKKKVLKAKSAYNYFQKEMRDKVKEENPDATPKDMMSLMATKWKELKESTKTNDKKLMDKFIKMSEEDKEKIRNLKGEVKKSKKPTGKTNGYLLFLNDRITALKQTRPQSTYYELKNEANEEWKEHKFKKSNTYKKYQAKAEEENESRKSSDAEATVEINENEEEKEVQEEENDSEEEKKRNLIKKMEEIGKKRVSKVNAKK